MAGDILSIGKSGLFAAQAGLSTTGHNITNANVAGYSRQVVVQATTMPVESANGFYGTGTKIATIKRYTDEFLNAQVRNAQSSKSGLDAYDSQIGQIDDLLADTSAGLSPALQDFFKGVQNVTGNRASTESRQSLMSAAETLASRFQQMDGRLQEIREGVNSKITSSVTLINSYANQIAELNSQIANFAATPDRLPNDLMDQRDQLVLELNKQVKATVMPGDNNSLTVSIGNGSPLVVGKQVFTLAASTSPTDQSRVVVGYQTAGKVTVLAENALTGGELGGMLDFRLNSLDRVQNSLGRIAIGLAQTFNDQHQLGLDANGNQGKPFFTIPGAFVGKNVNNNLLSTTVVTAKVSDPSQVGQSDFRVDYNGANFIVTRLSDNTPTTISPYPQVSGPQTIFGVDFTISGSAAAGDNFLVKPTINGAADFTLALTSRSEIAAAAPIATSKPLTNTGTGAISPGTVDASYFAGPTPAPLKLTFSAGNFTLLPATAAVNVTVNGVTTPYAAGAAIPFTPGKANTFTVNGMSFDISGAPQDGDNFSVARNTGMGDVRNAGLLGDLQTKNIFDNKSATYQSAYAEMVSFVGNKAREVQVNADAGDKLLTQVRAAAQDVAGVNLDEEATNLLRYQQAYQAAGKVMQIASTIFDTLLSIGH